MHAGNHAAYLRAIEEEAERARSLYGLLLVPGLEICNDPDPVLAAHAVAVGLRSFVSPQVGIAAAIRAAREAGAAIIAAHPHGEERDAFPLRTTQRFFREWDQLAPLVDRVELFNRHDAFPWVAARRLPAVAKRRLPSPGASLLLEDASSLRLEGAGRDRPPALAEARVPPALRRRAAAGRAARGRVSPRLHGP